jgi:hypothetical protein
MTSSLLLVCLRRIVLLGLALAACLSAPGVRAQVVISEVHWAGSDLSTADEWLELTALSDVAQTLSGWTLSTVVSDVEAVMVRLPADRAVGQQPVLVSNFPASASRLDLDPQVVNTALSLSNSALHLRLRDAFGQLVDEVGTGGAPAAGQVGSALRPWASMERISLSAAGTDAANWRTASEARQLDAGAPVFGTPGVSSTVFASSSSFSSVSSSVASSSSAASTTLALPASLRQLRFTELLADPFGADDGEWLEVGNLGSEPVDLSLVTIERAGTSNLYRFVPQGGSGVWLSAGAHLWLPREQTGLILPNDGATLRLLWQGVELDRLTYGRLAAGASQGLLQGVQAAFCLPTPGEPNAVRLPEVSVVSQTGLPTGEAPLRVDVQAVLPEALPGGLACHWTFGDGSEHTSCNPPAHTFERPGSYNIELAVRTICGEAWAPGYLVQVRRPGEALSVPVVASSSQSLVPAADVQALVEAATLTDAPSDFSTETRGRIVRIFPSGEVLFRPVNRTAHWRLSLGRGLSVHEVDQLSERTRGQEVVWSALEVGGDEGVVLLGGEEVLSLLGDVTPVTTASSSSSVAAPLTETTASPSATWLGSTLAADTGARAEVGDVVISEVLSRPLAGGEEWVELQNQTHRSLSIAGWLLDDAEEGGSRPWVLPVDAVLEPGAFVVFPKSRTGLALNDAGDDVVLRRGTQLMDIASVPTLVAGGSYVRADGGEGWCVADVPTPGWGGGCDLPEPEFASHVQAAAVSSGDVRERGQTSLSQATGEQAASRLQPQDPSGQRVGWTIVVLLGLGGGAWLCLRSPELVALLREKAPSGTMDGCR